MTTTTSHKLLATLILFIGLTLKSQAQTYYDVYICGNKSVKLHMSEENTLNNGDKVHWFDENDNAIGTPITFNGISGVTDLTIPASLTVGLHTYKTRIESVGGCLGDPSEPYTIYKLPTKQLALSENRAAYCADESNTIKDATITATTTPAATLPDGFEYAYTWSVTKNGNAYSPLSDIGSSDNSTTTENKFKMTTKDAGTYVFSATVKYVKTAANTGGVLVAEDSDGCSVSQTATQTITVTPKPGKPTIIMLVN